MSARVIFTVIAIVIVAIGGQAVVNKERARIAHHKAITSQQATADCAHAKAVQSFSDFWTCERAAINKDMSH